VTVGASAVLGLLALAAVLYSTDWAPWVFTDSVAYLLSAENMAAGGGLGVWTAGGRFASLPSPGYPALLALLTVLGLEVVDAARWVGAWAFGLLVGGVTLAGVRITRSPAFGVGLGAVTLCQPGLIRLYSGAMTDPLTITLSVGALAALAWSLSAGSRAARITAGILSGLAILTRHAAAALIPTGILAILMFSQASLGARVRRAAGFAAAGLLPAAAWQVYADATAATGPPRGLLLPAEPIWQALTPARIAAVRLLWSQVPWARLLEEPPYRVGLLALSLCFAIGGLGLIYLRRGKAASNGKAAPPSSVPLTGVAGLYLASYVGVVTLGFLFTDPTPDVDARTLLAPLTVPLWIWWLSLPLLAARVWPNLARWTLPLIVVLAAGGLAPNLTSSLEVARQLHADGAGYTGRAWSASGVASFVRGLPGDMPLIASDSAAIHFLTRRPAFELPELAGMGPRPIDSRFGDDSEDPIESLFREQGAALILFDSVVWRLDGIYGGKGAERLAGMTRELRILEDTWDGTIYVYPGPA
jgi:hypothetical protein